MTLVLAAQQRKGTDWHWFSCLGTREEWVASTKQPRERSGLWGSSGKVDGLAGVQGFHGKRAGNVETQG